jgi:hypothetical protein
MEFHGIGAGGFDAGMEPDAPEKSSAAGSKGVEKIYRRIETIKKKDTHKFKIFSTGIMKK